MSKQVPELNQEPQGAQSPQLGCPTAGLSWQSWHHGLFSLPETRASMRGQRPGPSKVTGGRYAPSVNALSQRGSGLPRFQKTPPGARVTSPSQPRGPRNPVSTWERGSRW